MEIVTIPVGVDNCYLVRDEGCVLVDGGMSGYFDDFKKSLQKQDISPTSIQVIIVTHCHFDHIGCLAKIKALTGAKVIAHRLARPFIENGKPRMPRGFSLFGRILYPPLSLMNTFTSLEPCVVDVVVDDANYSLKSFGIDGTVIYTPGHSPGSLSVLLSDGSALVGDMAMNGLPLTLGPDLPIFGDDMPGLLVSWETLINRGCKMVYPAHGKPFEVQIMKDIISRKKKR